MMPLHSSTRAALALVVIALPTVAFAAAETPLAVIPETADVVIRLKKPKATLDALVRTAGGFDPKFGAEMKKHVSAIGAMIGNTSGAGVDANKDWYIAYFFTPGKPAGIVYAIPTTNAANLEKAVKEGLGGTARIKSHEKWSFYSASDAAMTLALDGLNGTASSMEKRLDAEALALFDRHDIGMIVNVRHLTEDVYKLEMQAYQTVLQAIQSDLATAKLETPGLPDIKQLFGFYAHLFEAGLGGISNIDHITGGASLKGAGVDAEQMIQLKDGASLEQLLPADSASAIPLMEKLPANRLLYVGMSGPVRFWNATRFQIARFASSDQSAGAKAFQGMGDFGETKFGTQAASFHIGDPKEGLIRTVTVTETSPVEATQKLMRSLLAVMHPAAISLSATSEVTEDGEDIEGQKVDVVRLKLNDSKDAAPQLWQKLLQGLFRGNEAGTMRVAYRPDTLVETVGGGPDAMTEALQGLSKSSEASDAKAGATAPKSNAAFLGPRGRVAPKANVVVMVDAAAFAAELMRVGADVLGSTIPVQSDQVKKLGLKRSYMGLSIAAEEKGIRLKAHVPTNQLQSMSKVWPLLEKVLPKLGVGSGTMGPGGAPMPGAM
jgi:hypothetical protein